MSLIRYNKPVFQRRFNHVFDSLIDELNNNNLKVNFQPKVSISENEQSFSVNAELPGVKKENIHVDLEENSLTISGEKKFKNEEEKDNYHLVESSYGSFSRTFYLPENTSKEKIDAKFEDGVLLVTIPKEEVKKISSKIKINF